MSVRIRTLSLSRHGAVGERHYDLPQSADGSDLHVICGANASGKSVTRRAIGDFFFGIPRLAAHRFGSEYTDMEIAADLETPDGAAGLIRQKKTPSLTNAAREAVDEAVLQRWLRNIDRATFDSAFAMDRDQLHAGADEMLKGKGAAGEALYAAMSGITGLSAMRAQLAEAAAAIYSVRSKQSTLNLAMAELKDARAAARGAVSLSSDYAKDKAALDAANERLTAARNAVAELNAERDRASARLALRPAMQGLAAAEADWVNASGAPALPDGASDLALRVQTELSVARAELRRCEAAVNDAAAALEAGCDELPALAFSEEIRRLPELRGAAAKTPARIAEAEASAKEALSAGAAAAQRLGWPSPSPETFTEEVRRRLPTAAAQSKLSRLVGEGAAVKSSLSHRADERQRLQARVKPGGGQRIIEVSQAATLAADLQFRAKKAVGIAGREAAAARSALEARRARNTALIALGAAAEDVGRLRLINAPSVDHIAELITANQQRTREMDAVHAKVAENIAEQAKATEELKRLSDTGAVTEEQLTEAREKRNQALAAAKAAPADGGLWASAMSLLGQADQTADQRYTHAAEAAQHQALTKSLSALDAKLVSLAADLEAINDKQQSANNRWQQIAAALGEPSLPVETAASWLWKREALIDAEDLLINCDAEHGEASRELSEMLGSLRSELSTLHDGPLSEYGAEELEALVARRLSELTAEKASLTAEARAATEQQQDLAEANRRHAEAEAQAEAWRGEWAAAIAEVGAPPSLDLEDANSWIAAAESIRTQMERYEHAVTVELPRARQPVQDLNDSVTTLFKAMSLGPMGAPIEGALRLEKLRDEQAAAKADRDRMRATRDEALSLAAAAKSRIETAEAEIAPLLSAAGCDMDSIHAAIDASRRRRDAEERRMKAKASAQRQAPAGNLTEAEALLAGHDDDADQRRLDEIASIDGPAAMSELEEAKGAHAEAEAGLNRWSGSATAAEAQGRLSEATEAVRQCLVDYARLISREKLLKAGIEAFRKRHEGPMLARSSGYFQRLTGGLCRSLEVDHDAEEPRMVARRADGTVAEIDQLSEGQRDQLFLALRLSALDQSLETGPALPFIADDLLMTFDDERAADALAVLKEISTKTQVIYFTHHKHLQEIAVDTCGVNVATCQPRT